MTVRVGPQNDYRIRGVALSEYGTPIRNAPYTVTDLVAGGAATIYTDRTLSTPIVSPKTTSEGIYEFWVPPSTYRVNLTGERVQQPEDVTVGDDVVWGSASSVATVSAQLATEALSRATGDTTWTRFIKTASYAIVAGDEAKWFDMNAAAGPLVFTVDGAVNLAQGTKLQVTQYGSFPVTIAFTNGATVVPATAPLTSVNQGDTFILHKRTSGAGEWMISYVPAPGTFDAVPTTTDAVWYVSKGANANDANSGLSAGKAFATVAAAVAARGANPGVIQLLQGTFALPAAGVDNAARQYLRGIGRGGTKLDATAVAGTYAVRNSGSRGGSTGFWVTNVPTACTAVRATISATSNENSRWDDLFVDGMGAASIAYGVGDDTAGDVSELLMTGCDSVGNGVDTIHMKVGNGGTGNVLDNTNIGGNAQGHQYGLVINGGALVSVGLNFQTSAAADIWLKQNALGAIVIRGGRSETAFRFVQCDFGGAGTQGYNAVEVADYTAQAMSNTDGKGVITTSAYFKMRNVVMLGATCPQYVFYTANTPVDSNNPAQIMLDKVATEHLYQAGGTPFSRPNELVVVRDPILIATGQLQSWSHPQRRTSRVRRYNVNDATAFTIDPRLVDEARIKLQANAGTITLPSGYPGQQITLTFVQDQTGGRTYILPVLCAADPAYAAVTTASHRQSVTFMWDGHQWAQTAPAFDFAPLAVAGNVVADNFAGASGARYFLDTPSGGGPFKWEHVPGGGMLGSDGAKCVTRCLGPIGEDVASGGFTGLTTPVGAAAVIETGKLATTIAMTFVFRGAGDGMIAYYLDDQNFVAVRLASNVVIGLRGFIGGALSWNPGNDAVSALTVGNTYTMTVVLPTGGPQITVQITGAGYAGYGPSNWGVPLARFTGTKHGIVSGQLATTFSAFSTT